MTRLQSIRIFGVGIEDISFFLRALLTRPGDIPGILRREAARRRANLPQSRGTDEDGLRVLIDSWIAAHAAGGLAAPAGQGAALDITIIDDPLAIVTALQNASSVRWRNVSDHPAFAALSLEAARLSLPQIADRPADAAAARQAYLDHLSVSDDLRAALQNLANQPVGS